MALPLPAQDEELVKLARRGEEDAFGVLYERYFPGVYDFLTRLLRDRQEAADVAQDTFIKAFERLGHLRNPERFKSWVYTIAHRSALNRIERSKRAVAVGDFYVSDRESSEFGVVDADRAGDPERSAEARAAATLIWEAAAGLDPRTYSVMDLHVRQGLDSAEIADVLGISKSNAYTLVSRMKKSFSQTLSTYLLVRNGGSDCDELAAIVAAGGGHGLTPELRKSVDRHAKSCEVCQENRKVLFIPLKLFAALAAVPAPAAVKAAIWGSAKVAAIAGAATTAATGSSAGAGASAAGGGGGTSAGTPPPAGVVAAVKSSAGAIAAAAILILVLALGGFFLLRDGGEDVAAGDTEVLSAGAVATTASAAVETSAGPESTTAAPAPAPPTSATPAPVASTTSQPPPVASTSTTTRPPTTAVPPGPLVVRPDTADLAEDTSIIIDVLANDSGYAAGAAPRITAGPAHGTARVSKDKILYAPDANYAGTDQFTYSIVGRDGTTGAGQVAVSISGVNDAPAVPGPGDLTIDEDTVARFDPLANAVDVDGDQLTMKSYDPQSAGGGTITVGSLIYAPPQNWSGSDSFSYVVTDGTVNVTVTVSIHVDAVNDAPSGPDPVLTGTEDGTIRGNILAGWDDIEGDDVFVADPGARTTAEGGRAVVGSQGATSYTPPADFTGSDSFPVSISDGTDSVTVSVTVIVAGENDPPIVADVTFTVPEDTAVGTVLGVVTATDPDGDDVTFEQMSQSVIQLLADGTVILIEPLDFEIAASHELGAQAVDEQGAATDFSVFVTVGDVDEAPRLADHTFSVPINAPPGTVAGRVVGTDPEGEALTYRITGGAGMIAINAVTGDVTLLPAGDAEQFPVEAVVFAADPGGNEASASLTIVQEDGDGPDITAFSSDVSAFYEPPFGGGVCPSRPRSAVFSATITDASGVLGADLHWRITVLGVETTGVAKMSFVDNVWLVDLSAPRGILVDRNPATLFAKVVARDFAGNFSQSAELGVTVLPCDTD